MARFHLRMERTIDRKGQRCGMNGELKEPYERMSEVIFQVELALLHLLTGIDRTKDDPNLVVAIHHAGQLRIAFEKYAKSLGERGNLCT